MSYNDDLQASMRIVRESTILYREGQFEKAWKRALTDPLLASISRSEWFDWCARKEFGISHSEFVSQVQ